MKEVTRRSSVDMPYVFVNWKWFVVWDTIKMKLTPPRSHISNVILQVRIAPGRNDLHGNLYLYGSNFSDFK